MKNSTGNAMALKGRRVLSRDSVTVSPQPVCVGDGGSTSDAFGVELMREGAVTREIHVRCSCGQTVILECEYPNDGSDQ